MVCEKFKEYRPKEHGRILLNHIKTIIEEYTAKGLVLTSRQIHYQLVSKNLIKNTQSEYNKVTNIIADARMAGEIDWSAIVDRNRSSRMHYHVLNIPQAIEDTLYQYRLNRMFLQDVYIEVMIEKMAIYEIVEQVTNRYSIRLTGDKGFCSKTILYDISKRLLREQEKGKSCVILYIGDHDPSGLTMDTSIVESLCLMGVQDFEFRRVALTHEQVIEYNLPPNMIKDGDKNSDKYRKSHGGTSWECDALPSDVLQDILEREILSLIDFDKYAFMCEKEEKDREKLKQIIETIEVA